MIKNYLAVILMSFMVLSGCSTSTATDIPVTRTTMVTSGELSLLSHSSKVFGWHPTMFKVHAPDSINSDAVVKLMQEAIIKTMEAKGYHLANAHETPSVLIGFGLALESEMSDKEILKRAGLVAGLSTDGVDDKYEKGSVLVALFSPYNSMPIWRVLAQGFTELDKKSADREQRFERLISRMLTPVPEA